MQTDVYELIANEEDFAQVSLDLFTYCSGFKNCNVTFYKQEVKNIDFDKRKVITTIDRLSYDYLVIAVGSRTKFAANVEGAKAPQSGSFVAAIQFCRRKTLACLHLQKHRCSCKVHIFNLPQILKLHQRPVVAVLSL